MAENGFSPRIENQLEETFFEQGKVSIGKIDEYEKRSKVLREEIIGNLIRYYEQVGGKNHEKAVEKALESDTAVGYDRMAELTKIMKKASPANAKKIGLSVLELGFALRSDGKWMDY